MTQISIVGFGRFGKTLYRLLKDDFSIVIYSRNPQTIDEKDEAKHTPFTQDLKKIYSSTYIFYAVPISAFDEVIQSHLPFITEKNILIDVLSVKLHPMHVFTKYLKDSSIQAILTHPMFGPDSTQNGFSGLPIIIDKFRSSDETFAFWVEYLTQKKLNVIQMSPSEHDTIAGNSQGLTHFIGRLLDEYPLTPSSIDSIGTQKLLEIREQTCNDTWQLFMDLQHFNPHTKHMRIRLGEIYDSLYNKLLPKQRDPNSITFGIQGGEGSFNEEALQYYVKREGISDYTITYLYTSGNVLHALHIGDIDRGLFATHNSVGGIVNESIEAMAKYKFNIVNQFAIKISHALLIRKDAQFSEITEIMSHPQVFAQCKETLSHKYPSLKLINGEGELIDHAKVAKELSEKKLPKHIATMGSRGLAKLYNLTIIEDNLEDARENYTSFLLASRI